MAVRVSKWWGLILVLLLGSPVLAQDGGTTSAFKAFFWSSDYLGLVIIWLLLIMSMISIALSILFTVKYRKSQMIPEDTQIQLEQMLSEKRYREAIDYAESDPSYLAQMISAALAEAANGYGAMERAVEETSDTEISRQLRPIEILNVMGNISPMMGLFGTVYGMIVAFQKLVDAGGQPDPAMLAAGISTALVTTFWGLVVAIPALAAYALVRNKLDAIGSEGMLIAEEMIAAFRPGAKKAAASKRPQATPKPSEEG